MTITEFRMFFERTFVFLFLVIFTLFSCENPFDQVIKKDIPLAFEADSIQLLDTTYILNTFSTPLKWKGNDTLPVFEDLSSTSFLSITKNIVTVSPQEADTGTYHISIRISDQAQKADTLNWTLAVLKGKGRLTFGWSTGLSGAVDSTYIKIEKGQLNYLFTIPTCHSVGSRTFDNIEAGIWNYKVVQGKSCNDPCYPTYHCPDTSSVRTGLIKVINGQEAYL